jgi:hypothetical protein
MFGIIKLVMLASAVHPSTQTDPAVLPPNPHPVAAGHQGSGVEVVAAEKEAFWPSDNASEVATTLPPPLPSPEAMTVAPKAMATSSTAIPTAFQPCGGADVMVPESMGPSQHVEEVLPGLQHLRKNNEKANITETPLHL